MQDKLIELETKYSFQEEMLQELNEVIIRQQNQIDALNSELEQLKSQMVEVSVMQAEMVATSSQDEKPPHY